MSAAPLRRALLISPHFPPDGSAAAHRVRVLAPYLPEHGWDPVVLTVETSGDEPPVDPELAALVPPSLKVIRARAWSRRWTRPFGIGDLGLRAFAGLRRSAIAAMARQRFDVLFVTTYPTYPALLGPALKGRFRVPFVLDYQDPWVGSWGLSVGGAADGGPDLKSRLSRRLAVSLEPLAVRAADAITAVSARTYEEVLARIPLARAPVVATLPIGWDPGDANAAADGRTAFFDRDDGAVHLAYVGTLLPNGVGVLRSLFRAARLLRDRGAFEHVRLHFFGTSNQFADDAPLRVLPVAAECGVADIVTEHAPRVSYLDALRILRQSSGILLLGSSESHYTPSKMYPAIVAAQPILAVFRAGTEAAAFLGAFGHAPSVRLVTFDGDAPAPDALSAPLTAMAGAARYDASAVDWRVAAPCSGRALAATLAHVFDRVAN